MNVTTQPRSVNLRSKGRHIAAGHLVKGCVKDATTKLSIGSIPSNFESIIYKTQSNKAFGSSSKRFFSSSLAPKQTDDTIDEKFTSPCQQTVDEPKSHCSHSIKGYGPFLSRDKRQFFRILRTPGPGQYAQMRQVQTANEDRKRHNYLRKTEQTRKVKKNVQPEIPGPGAYDILVERPQTSACESVFKSRFTRGAYIGRSETPGPGFYRLENSNNKENMSPARDVSTLSPNEKASHIISSLFPDDISQQPGPGAYNPTIPDFKPLYEKIKVSHSFAPAQDRFKCRKQLRPEPGAYDVVSAFTRSEQVKLISWPCFMSESARQVFKSVQKEPNGATVLGLAKNSNYDPSRQSNFHLNVKGEWV